MMESRGTMQQQIPMQGSLGQVSVQHPLHHAELHAETTILHTTPTPILKLNDKQNYDARPDQNSNIIISVINATENKSSLLQTTNQSLIDMQSNLHRHSIWSHMNRSSKNANNSMDDQ